MIVVLLFLIQLAFSESSCGIGWQKVGNHCRDINECRGDHGCGLRQRCKNLQGSFECNCVNGFAIDSINPLNTTQPGNCLGIVLCFFFDANFESKKKDVSCGNHK